MTMSEDRKIQMPPDPDKVVTRLDGWLTRDEVDPDHPPPAIEAMLLIPRHDDADEVEVIRQRMLARHAAVFGGGDE
jgi:hypothetical protein